MSWLATVVIGRILAESGLPPPAVADQALLLIKRHDVVVGCSPGDGGAMGDAATDAMAGADGGVDDAGIDDAGVDDAGVDDAGTCTTIPGDAVTLVVQPHVSTTIEGTRFAVLLVTPDRPIVELAGDVFSGLELASAPRIETRTVEVPDRSLGTQCASSSSSGGCGGGYYEGGGGGPPWDPPDVGDGGLGDGAVVEEMIGPYQFVRAQPTSSSELAEWLDQLGYAYMPADLDAVAPYIARGYHVLAIRVAVPHPLSAPMIPISLTWQGNELRVPAALGHGAVSPGVLTVYVAAEGKYQFANAKIRFAGRTSPGESGYVTRNEITLDQNLPPELDPIAYPVATSDFREVEVVTHQVRVPVDVDCYEDDDDGGGWGCCCECNAKPRTRVDLLLIVFAVGVMLRRRRR